MAETVTAGADGRRSSGGGAFAAAVFAVVVCALLVGAVVLVLVAPADLDPAQPGPAREELMAGTGVIQSYVDAHGEVPSEERGEELLREAQLLDPWGNPLRFETRADGWSVTSAGADGELGTDDDAHWHAR